MRPKSANAADRPVHNLICRAGRQLFDNFNQCAPLEPVDRRALPVRAEFELQRFRRTAENLGGELCAADGYPLKTLQQRPSNVAGAAPLKSKTL